jgi:hypothetical protein
MAEQTPQLDWRQVYAMRRMRLAINRAIQTCDPKEKQLAIWWVAGWACYCRIKCAPHHQIDQFTKKNFVKNKSI